jgi:hypothetical protein
MRKLPIPVRGSALPVLVPILELTSFHFLIRIFPKYDRIHGVMAAAMAHHVLTVYVRILPHGKIG